MGLALSLRLDFDGSMLRHWPGRRAMPIRHGGFFSLASIYDGGLRADAARLGSVTVQIVRDRVIRFNARGPD